VLIVSAFIWFKEWIKLKPPIVTRLRAGLQVNCELILSRDRVFASYTAFRVALGPTNLLFGWCKGLFPVVKQPGHGADHIKC